jgi:hypothetical protein
MPIVRYAGLKLASGEYKSSSTAVLTPETVFVSAVATMRGQKVQHPRHSHHEGPIADTIEL